MSNDRFAPNDPQIDIAHTNVDGDFVIYSGDGRFRVVDTPDDLAALSTRIDALMVATYTFARTTLPANSTGALGAGYGSNTVLEVPVFRAGRLIGAAAALGTALTAGTAAVRPRKNGVHLLSGYTLPSLTTSAQTVRSDWGWAGGMDYAPGDTIGCEVVTDASTAPNASIIYVALHFLMRG